MYAKIIHKALMLQCSIGSFVVRSFLCRKPGCGAQRQVSVTYSLSMCDVWSVHISNMNVSLYDHKIRHMRFCLGVYTFDVFYLCIGLM
jgi:hypothetical protein